MQGVGFDEAIKFGGAGTACQAPVTLLMGEHEPDHPGSELRPASCILCI